MATDNGEATPNEDIQTATTVPVTPQEDNAPNTTDTTTETTTVAPAPSTTTTTTSAPTTTTTTAKPNASDKEAKAQEKTVRDAVNHGRGSTQVKKPANDPKLGDKEISKEELLANARAEAVANHEAAQKSTK